MAYLERTTTLDRLSAIGNPTPDERFERARLVETLHGSDEALPLYQSAAAEGHAAASLAAGRVLLDRMDAAGVALKATEARDVDALFGSGEAINEACDACHAKYQEQ